MCAIVLAAGLAAAQLGGPSPADNPPRYTSAADLRASVARTTAGVAGAPIPTGSGALVLMTRRTETGRVEIHARFNDEFIVQSGRATVMVGGVTQGDREIAPGERQADTIVGATPYALGPGDALWIPAGEPHQVVVPKGSDFLAIVIKFEAKAAVAP